MSGSPKLLALAIALGLSVGAFAWLNGYGAVAACAALAMLGLVQLAEGQQRKASDRIREALRRADISLGNAAAYMQMDQGDLTRALAAERKLDLWRLEMLPDTFWREYWPLLARDKGLPESFQTAARVLPMVLSMKETA